MKRNAEAIKKFCDRDFPVILGVEYLKHKEQAFRDQGFTDSSLKPWAKRKAAKSKKQIARDTGRSILVKTGELKRSGRYVTETRRCRIIFDKPYAQVHNEGGKAGRGKGFTMRKRQYIGPSRVRDKLIKIKIDKRLLQVLK